MPGLFTFRRSTSIRMKKMSLQLIASLGLAAAMAAAAHAAAPLPQLVQKDGRHALMVDGAPFLMLSAQAHNSSNYPKALPKVWAATKDLNANTVEVAVAWEQVEPVEGKFDFSFVDTLVKEARQNKMRLVIVWFGTWKNTSPQYTPEWVKFNNERFPRMLDKDGKAIYCLSPHGEETLKADKKAFTALMSHIAKIDAAQRTVIMVQVENEVGTYGFVRDFSPKAQALFNQPVPQKVLEMKKSPVALAAKGTWKEVYGDYADEYFHAYSIASYIGEIAKSGRAVYNLPMYVNNALRDPIAPLAPWKNNFASGGPTYDVIDIYKAAAPAIDVVGPDIYNVEYNKFSTALKQFKRPDNALFVPELGNHADYARYTYLALGSGAIGFAPFGMDYANYTNFPLGSKFADKRTIEPFARIYAAFRPMARHWAKWAFEGRTYGVAESDERTPETVEMKGWKATVSFREWQFGEKHFFPTLNDTPEGCERPNGGVAIAQIGENEFILVGHNARVKLDGIGANEGKRTMLARVEEGHFDSKGQWIMERNWNGDQVDYGINMSNTPTVLKVRIGTY